MIRKTWLHNFRTGNDDARLIDRDAYMVAQDLIITNILVRDTVKVLVACDADVEAAYVDYGFICFEQMPESEFDVWKIEPRDIIHYIYVKEAFRRLGLCNALVIASGVNPNRCYFTHYTRDRLESNPHSPYVGQLRYRGAETLLHKWTMQWYERDPKNPQQKIVHPGNKYLPYLR